MNKAYKLDILRFIFAICVLAHHTYLLNTPNKECILFGGYRAVEFFYIVTGFLMANSIVRLEGAYPPRMGGGIWGKKQ